MVLSHVTDLKRRRESLPRNERITQRETNSLRMMLIRIAKEKELPFEPLIPNKETIKGIEAARHGKVVEVGSIDNLLGFE